MTDRKDDVEGFLQCISEAHSGNRVEGMWLFDALNRAGYLRTPREPIDVEGLDLDYIEKHRAYCNKHGDHKGQRMCEAAKRYYELSGNK